jgi:uncharacterized glyoxalase superfamily metalloenzyme YdcJ
MNFHDTWQGEFCYNLPVPVTATGIFLQDLHTSRRQLAKYSSERKKHYEHKLQREIKHIFVPNILFA